MDTFLLEWRWTAVHVDASDGNLLTSMHVVMDDDGNHTDYFYEICSMDNATRIPDNCYLADFVRYNAIDDLALLSVHSNFSSFSDSSLPIAIKDPSLGDTVYAIGFPGNGGGTVSITKGIINGEAQNAYKIDANIDGGNSWGPVINGSGELIGIAGFVIPWYTTQGYAIKRDNVADFLAGRTSETVPKEIFDPRNDLFKEYFAVKNTFRQSNILTKWSVYLSRPEQHQVFSDIWHGGNAWSLYLQWKSSYTDTYINGAPYMFVQKKQIPWSGYSIHDIIQSLTFSGYLLTNYGAIEDFKHISLPLGWGNVDVLVVPSIKDHEWSVGIIFQFIEDTYIISINLLSDLSKDKTWLVEMMQYIFRFLSFTPAQKKPLLHANIDIAWLRFSPATHTAFIQFADHVWFTALMNKSQWWSISKGPIWEENIFTDMSQTEITNMLAINDTMMVSILFIWLYWCIHHIL